MSLALLATSFGAFSATAATETQLTASTPEQTALPSELDVSQEALGIDLSSEPIKLASENVNGVSALLEEDFQEDNIGQVTSVSQLSDVSPTDWAFQAVQSLVERYGCIAGYPDGTFRGNRAATRYELAAALNACLDQISDRFATKEDLDAVKALQEEFAAELATLRGRVDGLEARTATLEAQQFSTTTKLQANAVFLAQFGDTGGSTPFNQSANGFAADPNPDSRASLLSAVYLSLNTSFSGDDLLQTTLLFGNGGSDFIDTLDIGSTPTFAGDGFSEDTPFFNPGQSYFSGVPGTVSLYRLAYDFKPVKDVTLKVAPLFYPTDVIDANSFTSPFTGFATWQSINNPLITPYLFNFAGGQGGAITWNPSSGPFTARAVYVTTTGNSPVELGGFPGENGLFGAPRQATAELEYADDFGSSGNNNFAVRLQYTNSAQNALDNNALGINVEAKFGQFGVFGRYGYSFSDANFVSNPVPFALGNLGEFQVQTFQAGAGVFDLLIPGSLLAASIGAPFFGISDTDLGAQPIGVNDQTQFNIEAFYRIPVSDNISVTPTFTAIINPNNSSIEPNVFQGSIRTVFSF